MTGEHEPATPATKGDVFWNVVLGAFMLLSVGRLGYLLFTTAPKFRQIFEEMGLGELPLSTRTLLGASWFCQRFWYLAAPLGILAVVLPTILLPFRKARWVWLAAMVGSWYLSAMVLQALYEPMMVMMQKLGASG